MSLTLTPTQLTTLKAAILADPALSNQPMTNEGHQAIAAAMNLDAFPSFFGWKTLVTTAEIMANGFAWDRVDNADAGKARIWEWMTQLGELNPATVNVRAGINAAWPTAANDAMRLSIFGHCQRLATRAEKLFTGGTGTTTSNAGVGPATLLYTGTITADDVESARQL